MLKVDERPPPLEPPDGRRRHGVAGREQHIVILQYAVHPTRQRALARERALEQRPRNQPSQAPDRAGAPFQSLRMGDRAGVVAGAPQVAHDQARPGLLAVVGVALGDLVAERAQQLDRVLERAAGVGVGTGDQAGGNARGVGDAQLPRRCGGGGGERHVGGRRAVAVDLAGPRDDVVEQRRVRHPASEYAVHGQAVPVASVGRERHASALGLEPEQPAPRGGDADRAGAVGGERGAHEPGGHRRAAAPTRAAGRPLQVPGVAGDAEGGGLGERPQAQLGHVGLADDHRAGVPQASHDLGVRAGGLVLRVGAFAGELADHVDVVLDGDRHPQQRAAATCRAALGGAAARVGLVGLEAWPVRRTPRETRSGAGPGGRCARGTDPTSSREETSPAAISSA